MKMLVENFTAINLRFQIVSNTVYVELCLLMDYSYEK